MFGRKEQKQKVVQVAGQVQVAKKDRPADPIVDGLPTVRDHKPYADAVAKLTFLEENARNAEKVAKDSREQADLAVMAATLAAAELTVNPEKAEVEAEEEHVEDTPEARLQQAARASIRDAARKHPGEDLKRFLQAEAEQAERRARMAEFMVNGSKRAVAEQKKAVKETRKTAERFVDAEVRRRHEKMAARFAELWAEMDQIKGQHDRLKMAACRAKERLGEGGDGWQGAAPGIAVSFPRVKQDLVGWMAGAKKVGYRFGGE